MGMSYRRAWLLIDSLNSMFRQPLVEAATGGAKGGGAALTPLGREVVAHYRAIESRIAAAAGLQPVPHISEAIVGVFERMKVNLGGEQEGGAGKRRGGGGEGKV